MEEKKLFHDRYFLERLLGRGNFSEVWLAKDNKTDVQVALKIYAPATGLDDAGLNVFAREFSIVVNANHKNLLKPLYYDSCDRKPYLVLPYCKQGSIMKLVGKFSEKDAWRLLRDVASGLAWLHGMTPPLIHQDIKPDNIMIGDNGDFMITDFGVSTHLRSTLRRSMSAAFSSAGTMAYMAPERFSKDNTPIMANDIYSLGATTYEMLSGDAPFGDDGGLMQKKGADTPELTGDYSPELKKLITKCLDPDPWKRPTAEQLERYATQGLEGKTILYDGEKTKWQKIRIPVIAGIVVIVAAIIGASVYFHGQAEKKAQQEAIAQAKAENDSINNAITKSVDEIMKTADGLVKAGDAHDEGYEESYVKAYTSLKNAEKKAAQMKDGAGKKLTETIKAKEKPLEAKLAAAYETLKAKRDMFADMPDIAKDFDARLGTIKAALGTIPAKAEQKDDKTDSKTDTTKIKETKNKK